MLFLSSKSILPGDWEDDSQVVDYSINVPLKVFITVTEREKVCLTSFSNSNIHAFCV